MRRTSQYTLGRRKHPYIGQSIRHQENFSLNGWKGIVGDTFIGPLLPPALKGIRYLHFREHDLNNVMPLVKSEYRLLS